MITLLRMADRLPPGPYSSIVALRCKELRRERDWSQEYLERRARLGSTTVTKIEGGARGSQVSIDVVVAIAQAFGMGLDEFVFGRK